MARKKQTAVEMPFKLGEVVVRFPYVGTNSTENPNYQKRLRITSMEHGIFVGMSPDGRKFRIQFDEGVYDRSKMGWATSPDGAYMNCVERIMGDLHDGCIETQEACLRLRIASRFIDAITKGMIIDPEFIPPDDE